MSSVLNDRSLPIRGGRPVNISSTDHTCDGNCRALYVGNGGDLKVTTVDDSVLTYVGILDGSIVPVHARLVWKVGTSASDILEQW